MTPLWRTPLETVWQADRFDQAEWLSATDCVPALKTADASASHDLCGHPVQDGFLGLFKANPQLSDEPAPALEPLAELLRRGIDTPEYARLRETTIGDPIAAGIGSQALVEEVLKALPAEAKQQAQTQAKEQQQADDTQAQADTLMALAEMLQERATDDDEAAANAAQQAEEVQRKALQAQASATQSQSRANAARAAFKATLNARSAQVTAALNHAAQTARQQAQDAAEITRGFSLAAGGDPEHVDPDVARTALEMLHANPNLKRLADLLGWAKKMVRGEWRKSPRGKTEMVGYATHALQPEHMAGFEHAALLSGDDMLHLDWLRRALDGGVRHRQYAGHEQQGRGPLVLVRDESGSMSGDPHAMAVALEWALLEICRREHRDFYAIPFSGTDQFHVWQAPQPGQPDPQGSLDHLSHFYNGGTEPYSPITKALESIEAGNLRADVLIITDDEFAEPSAEFLQRLQAVKQQRPVRVVAVIIGADSEQAQTFADQVIPVSDLLDDREQLRDAVAAIV